MKLGMHHQGLNLIVVCSDDDPGMTLTFLWHGQFQKHRLLHGNKRKQWIFWKLLQPEICMLLDADN